MNKNSTKTSLHSTLQPIGSLYLLSTHSTGCVIGLILVRPDVSGLFTGGHVQQIPQICETLHQFCRVKIYEPPQAWMLHCSKYYFLFFGNMSSLNEGVGMTPRAFSLHLTCFGPLSIHPLVFLSPLVRRSGSRGCCSLYPANLVRRQGYILDIKPSTLTCVPPDNLPIAGVLGL